MSSTSSIHSVAGLSDEETPPPLQPFFILPPVVRKRKSRYLLNRYSIDMNVLHRLGVKRRRSSFSRVTYHSIATVFGLDPSDTDLLDIPQFDMKIRKICYDVEVADVQYGQMITHNNEEARSRYIAAVFNKIIFFFGRIEHQFIAFGAWVPMLGILCDGTYFEFFVYDSSTRSFALSEPMKRLEQFQSDVEFLRSIKRS
ncbi:hypothetical protein Q9L58_010356 [Maublancomyces gigas]|uniref:Uncharacterized protein n=1 Tax=Discina gigas TaxID=1032678 RepID=A0ABR3G4D7_9PEZI